LKAYDIVETSSIGVTPECIRLISFQLRKQLPKTKKRKVEIKLLPDRINMKSGGLVETKINPWRAKCQEIV